MDGTQRILRPERIIPIATALFLMITAIMMTRAQTNLPIQIEENIWKVGIIQHFAITESSGLAASRNYPDVFWTHNDGGEQFVFAMKRTGEHLGAFEVQGANLIDWEAITTDEFGNLYLADIGTNGMIRTHSAIHRIEEPNPGDRWGPAKVEQTWLISFPEEREDCEGFFVWNGFGYLISKYPINNQVSLYRFALGSSSTPPLERVAYIPTDSPVSDAAISQDGNRLGLVNEEAVLVFFINGDPTTAGTATRRDTEYDNELMEGVTFASDGLLVTSDGIPDVLLFTSGQLTGAPIISRGLTDQIAFTGQSVEFSVAATAFPAPTYAWTFNGTLLSGQNQATLILTNLTLADSGTYEVTVSNPAGSATSSATLSVSVKTVDLRITEVMSSEAPGSQPTADWWELTSFDTVPVDLNGWRFNDSLGGLSDSFQVSGQLIIQPGESIVFVETLTPAQFRTWWGEANFPAGTQIVTYSGAALSFRAAGDSLRLWTGEAADDAAVFARVDFGAADVGVSFGYDPLTGLFGGRSQIGVNGAFRAATGNDVGSPGRIRNATTLALEGRLTARGLEIEIPSESASEYILEATGNLTSGKWLPIEVIRAGDESAIRFETSRQGGSRFYRVRKN